MHRQIEPVGWRSSAVEKQYARELTAVQWRANLSRAEVVGIGQVTSAALAETMKCNVVRREAERVVPDGAEQYVTIVWHGVLRMANVIDEM